MKTIYYRITLHEPTILTQIDGDPNSAVSYDFIPGSVLRGMMIGMVMRQYGLKELDLTNDLTRRLFFSDKTRFLNAYPIIGEQRALPVPNTWKQLKYPTDAEKYEIRDEAFDHEDDHKKRSGLGGFAILKDEKVHIYTPQRVLNVHTQRARKNASEQLVYRYDALAPGQIFKGIIYCEDNDATIIKDLLEANPYAHIGGARSAGYGKVRIHNVNVQDAPKTKKHPDNTRMVITLVSDMILRDKNGHYSPTLSAFDHALSNVHITFEDGIHHSIQTTLIGGFNRKWGLPLPQTPALKRGSVIVLNNVTINQEQFNHLLINGIGERRNEGFGQIAVNWQHQPTLTKATQEETQALVHKTDSLEAQHPQSKADSDAMLNMYMARQHIIMKEGENG